MKPSIVIDTNVFISALRSRQGAAYKLVMLIGKGKFDLNISVPLILEYEDVAKRMVSRLGLSEQDIDDILDYICSVATPWKVFFLWRPCLKDPKDDMVLELAVTSNCDVIVTYNLQDFEEAQLFGLRVMKPQDFLKTIGVSHEHH